jgi:hypothetical protein
LKIFIYISTGLFCLFSCINEDSLKPIIPNHLINANSAKVWVKTGHIVNNRNLSPQLSELRTTYTFFADGTFREQQMIHLGSNQGRKGYYSLIISEKKDTTFNLNYTSNEANTFHLDFIDVKSLKLSNDSVKWILKPLEPPKLK